MARRSRISLTKATRVRHLWLSSISMSYILLSVIQKEESFGLEEDDLPAQFGAYEP